MRPMLWNCVERQPGLSAVLFEWQQMLGDECSNGQKYLQPLDRQVTSIACRVACRPACWRRVVRHGPDHIVAVCDEGDPRYALDEADLLVYQLNLGLVCRDLCGALAIESAVEKVAGLHQTWQCGYVKSGQGVRHPVYLSIQMEDHHLLEVALRLSAMTRTRLVLLLPTTRRLSHMVRQVLESSQAV